MLYTLVLTLALLFVNGVQSTKQRTFTVALRQRNLPALENYVLRISNYKDPLYGQFLTTEQILEFIAPAQHTVNSLRRELSQQGIHCLSLGDALRCVAPESVVNSYFSINRNTYVIPSNIRDSIEFIEGLTETTSPDEILPKKHVIGNITVDPGYTGREVVYRQYNISYKGTIKEGLGAIEYQNASGFDDSDLALSQKDNGQPNDPIARNHVIGTRSFPDTETELDLQMMAQTAAGADIWFDGSSEWLYTWAVDFFNRKLIPYVVSHSWGWATDQQCTIDTCLNITSEQYVNRVNTEYLKLAARGITMTVASGDSGAPGRSNGMCSSEDNRTVVPVFPGSSPWVISVGATFIVANNTPTNVTFSTPLCRKEKCATGTAEATINTADVGWTAGGGFGEYLTEGQTDWQASAVNSYFQKGLPMPTYFNKAGRGYPDIAVLGHNCPTWEGDHVGGVDGTSCSSPTMAAIVGILNSHQMSRDPPRPRLGLATPLLYAMYYDDPSIYNDITVGNNWCTEAGCCPTRSDGGSEFGYLATQGWDPVTGLGTPNVGKMLAWLDKNT